MRNGLRSKGLWVSVIVVAAICCVIVLQSFTQKEASKKGNFLTTLLEAPLFISSAEAQTTTAFPADEAGIAAYVKVSAIDIEKMKPILTEAEQIGDNYIVGVTLIPNFGGSTDVHLYADTDGWLVAYIGADDQAAKIMQWGDADPKNPQISEIQFTTLEDALYSAGDVAGVIVAQRDIKYYNFEAPEANGMAIFIRTVQKGQAKTVQVELPETYTLYEASYYHYCYVHTDPSELKVDGSRINYITGPGNVYVMQKTFGSYKGAITTGTLHKIEVSLGSQSTYAAGVATVLIYKAP